MKDIYYYGYMIYDMKTRADDSELIHQQKILTDRKLADVVAEYADDFVGVLNKTRQFVLFNDNYSLDKSISRSGIGKRLGEVFGDEVRATLSVQKKSCLLEVENPSVMSREVKEQVFQRSFSTKGMGRGIGTYSIKLLGEKYLGGRISFSSDNQNGTVFKFELPLYTN